MIAFVTDSEHVSLMDALLPRPPLKLLNLKSMTSELFLFVEVIDNGHSVIWCKAFGDDNIPEAIFPQEYIE